MRPFAHTSIFSNHLALKLKVIFKKKNKKTNAIIIHSGGIDFIFQMCCIVFKSRSSFFLFYLKILNPDELGVAIERIR